MRHEKENRALMASCMGSMGMASGWLRQAESAIEHGQNESQFVASCQTPNRRKAKAAYALAIAIDAAKTSEDVKASGGGPGMRSRGD